MKKIFVMVLIAAYPFLASSQVRKIDDREVYKSGDTELGLTGNLGISYQTISTSNDYGYVYYSSNNREREIYLNLNAYGGYYLIDGLSIGPEMGIQLTFEEPTIFLTGNLCYIFNSESRSMFPYVKIGYGVTDIISYPGEERGLFESLNYKLFNLGAGLKILQSSTIAFNIEINYKNISGSDSRSYNYDPYTGPFNEKSDVNLSLLSFSFGSSIVL